MRRKHRPTKAAARTVLSVDKWRIALERIANLPSTHDGPTDEEEWNDMEDAFNNGCDVGRFEGFESAAAIAREALR